MRFVEVTVGFTFYTLIALYQYLYCFFSLLKLLFTLSFQTRDKFLYKWKSDKAVCYYQKHLQQQVNVTAFHLLTLLCGIEVH